MCQTVANATNCRICDDNLHTTTSRKRQYGAHQYTGLKNMQNDLTNHHTGHKCHFIIDILVIASRSKSAGATDRLLKALALLE